MLGKILAAIHRATFAHYGQTRASGAYPYIIHPLRVARKIERATDLPIDLDLESAILAAILHDTLEDTEISRREITEEFGERVAAIVTELTQDSSLPKAQRRALMIEKCKTLSLEARVVKLADRWDNLSEAYGMGEDFVRRYCVEARAMVENMKGTWESAEKSIMDLLDYYESQFEDHLLSVEE